MGVIRHAREAQPVVLTPEQSHINNKDHSDNVH